MLAIEFIHPQERDRLCACGCHAAPMVRARLEAIAMALRSAQCVEGVFDELVEYLPDDLPFDRLGLALLSEDGTQLMARRVYSTHPVLMWAPGEGLPLLGSSLEPLLREGSIRLIHDLMRYLQLRPSSLATKRLIEEGMRSSLAIPLYHDQDPLGVLFFTSAQPERYTPQHVAIAAALAPTIGQAFGRALASERAAAARHAEPPLAANEHLGPELTDQRIAPS